MNEQNIIGLVAGRGCLPKDVLVNMKERPVIAAVVGLKGEVDPQLSQFADYYQELPVTQLGAIIGFFKSLNISEVVFAGKVSKEGLFQGGFDAVFQRLLQELPEKNDDAILLAVVKEFEKNELMVAKQTDYLQQCLAQTGSIVGQITAAEMADVQLGFRIAKAMGGLDIGQSVVVKRGVILAVEAIEGTDQAIKRGGVLGGQGAVVVKVSKPSQDERFDVPTIGKSTIMSMIDVGATVLGIEAQKTLITEREQLLELALANQIKIVAV